MRRWLAIFLLVFMPLQLTWAAVSAYCQHESGAAAKHVGHHDHQHQVDSGQDSAPDPAKSGGTDPDCPDCNAGNATLLAATVKLPALAPPPLGCVEYQKQPTAPPPHRPERPQWRALA